MAIGSITWKKVRHSPAPVAPSRFRCWSTTADALVERLVSHRASLAPKSRPGHHATRIPGQ
jgi:hypothetical protein